MADRTLTVKIGANVSGFVSGMRTVAQATQEAAGKAEGWAARNREHIDSLAPKLAVAGAALVGFAALAVSRFADFDAAMSSVAAATMETTDNMALLREAAMEAGADTQYSATEAANAIEELAKAGVSTASILNGGLTGALNLAASAQMDVAEAAAITSTVMNQFSLDGSQASRIADVLAASAGKANGDVKDFGLAMKYVGPVASQLGVSLEETSGALAYLAQNGLLADSAGTGLRGVMMSLTAPTAAARKALDEYGISAFNAQGEFVGLESLAGQLQTQLGGLTEAERSAALGRMFGNEQITAARILYKGGAEEIATWTAAVDESGFAAEQARIKTDNLKGDIERLGGSFDTVLIQGGSGANESLRTLVQTAEFLVDGLGQVNGAALGATTMIAGAGGLALMGIAGIGKLHGTISDARGAMEALGLTSGRAKIAVAGVGAAIGVATLAFAAWADSAARTKARVDGIAQSLDQVTGEVQASTTAFIASDLYNGTGFMGWSASVADSAATIGVDLDTVTQAILGNADALAVVEEASRAATDRFSSQGEATDWLAEKAEAAGVDMVDYGNAMLIVRDGVEGYTGDIVTAAERTREIAKANATATGSTEDLGSATVDTRSDLEKYADEMASGATVTEGYNDALKEMLDLQREASGVVLSARDAQRQFEESLDSATDSMDEWITAIVEQEVANGASEAQARETANQMLLQGAALDITTEAGRRNQAALDDIASAGWDLIDAKRAEGASEEELQGIMARSREAYIKTATEMGLSEQAANALAGQLGLIPEQVSVDVAMNTHNAEENIKNLIRTRKLIVDVETRGTVVRPGQVGLGAATGGYIRGPGTGTSDSIPAWLSNGEFVMRAAAVQQYGLGMMHALNAGAYANGGEVATNPRPVLGYAGGGPVVNVSAPAAPSLVGARIVAQFGAREFEGYISEVSAKTTSGELTPTHFGRSR